MYNLDTVWKRLVHYLLFDWKGWKVCSKKGVREGSLESCVAGCTDGLEQSDIPEISSLSCKGKCRVDGRRSLSQD